MREAISDERDAPNAACASCSACCACISIASARVVIGPDLSHRRTVVDALLNADPVRAAIEATASKESITPEQAARKRARKYALEIAADYSHPVVRSISFMLKAFWNKLYDGVDVHHFDTLRDVAPGHEVIYVPCHRSHVDYLLLSYQLLTSTASRSRTSAPASTSTCR